jgi:predicted transcriptional regulator
MARAQGDEVGVNYRIPRDLHARAKALAAYQGRTFRAWVERALLREVERQEAERAEQDRKRRR